MLLHPCPQTWLCAKSKAEDRELEMDQKVYSADFSLWQIDINVCNDALQLDIKGLTEGLFSKNIKTEKLEVLLEKDEELQREAFDFSKSGHKAWNCGVNIRYPGTTKLEDLKVWDGSSEFRPWKSQICISKEFEGPFSNLIRLEIEGVTLKKVNGTCTKNGLWKLKADLAVTSKLASPLIPIQLMSKGKQTTHDAESVCGAYIAAQFTTQSDEGLKTTRVAEEGADAGTAWVQVTHGNPFNGLKMSSDSGTAKELRPLKEPGTSCEPANAPPDPGNTEMKPSNGLSAPSDFGTYKSKYMSYAEKMIRWLFMILICLSLSLSQAEGSLSGAQLVENIKKLDTSAICNTQEIPISCKKGLLPVCLFSVPDNLLAWGCAPNISINGKVCAEWNKIINGSYVVQGGSGNCTTCPPFYTLSEWKAYHECYTNDFDTTLAPATENTETLSP